MFELIKKDLTYQTNNGTTLHKIKHLIINHSVHLLLFIRFAHWSEKKIPLVGKIIRFILEYTIRIVFSSDISCKAIFGGGMNIMHGHDIVIGEKVIIGENCKIFNGVTIGNKWTETTEMEQPIIGNNVVIGTGAKILGKIHIGNNVIIGANSVVTTDIPPNTIWGGIPAREIKKRHPV